jgi:predicted ATPase
MDKRLLMESNLVDRKYMALNYMETLFSVFKGQESSCIDFISEDESLGKLIDTKKLKKYKNSLLKLYQSDNYNSMIETKKDESEEFFLLNRLDSVITRLPETGTGFSQMLPIIINAALMSESLITVEQPELHLHPGLQAKLSEVFIKSVKDNSNQFILETHSEHLIKAIQLQVAKFHASKGEDGISREDVSMVYIFKDPETGESRAKSMHLDEAGSFIEPWPDDFFESSSDLTFERLKLTNLN